VDIWFVVVPDQTISGIEFRSDDMARFRSDVSQAYGTERDRLQLQSIQATSVSGTDFALATFCTVASGRNRVCGMVGSPMCSLL
jgi:hypothetical protein